jgi:Nif-specific regulatory protein
MLGLSEALEAYEKELLQDALRQAKGIRSRAARLLMTSERVFSYRLRKHRIDTRQFRASR